MKRESAAVLAMIASLLAASPLAAADTNKTEERSRTNAGVKLPPYQELKLSNGATILLMERHDVPMIAFSARIRGGSVVDTAGKEGVASLVAEMLQRGAGKRDAAAFAEAVDNVGGAINTGSSREAITVSGNFLSRDANVMLELLADMLERPTFPESEIVKTRERMIDEIAAAKDADLRQLINIYFANFVYGNHLYGKPVRGTETSLAGLTREDVLTYYRNHLGSDRMTLAIVGDFSSADIQSRLRAHFGKWSKAAAPAPSIPAPQPVKGTRVLLVDKPDATQTYFWIGNTGIARNDPDRVPIELANTVFGGRFTSILNQELRAKSGLTYGANSVMSRETRPGLVAISTYTKTDTTEKAVDLALSLLDRYRKEGLDDAALASVKSYVLGQFPPRIETSVQLAARLAEIHFYGLDKSDVDRYAEMVGSANRATVNRLAARVYPARENLTFVFIGKADAIRNAVKKYGPVTEMKITDKTFTARAN
ncbi:MAG TPA: pitrilysin family protein [Thermoanaerobaculia bacterium]|nr:pitrilysin family protein [Thermoanaerobaculia bacterium]